jgi:hypothetical protein
MSYREERELNAAIGTAQSDVSREGEKRQRYVSQSDRTFNASVRLLLALKQDRRQHGDLSQDTGNVEDGPTTEALHPASTVASEPAKNDPLPAVVGAQTNQTQNEPETTQVFGQAIDNNPASTSPAVIPPAPAPVHHDPLLAVIEKYKNEFAHLREYDHLE